MEGRGRERERGRKKRERERLIGMLYVAQVVLETDRVKPVYIRDMK